MSAHCQDESPHSQPWFPAGSLHRPLTWPLLTPWWPALQWATFMHDKSLQDQSFWVRQVNEGISKPYPNRSWEGPLVSLFTENNVQFKALEGKIKDTRGIISTPVNLNQESSQKDMDSCQNMLHNSLEYLEKQFMKIPTSKELYLCWVSEYHLWWSTLKISCDTWSLWWYKNKSVVGIFVCQ